MLRLIFTFIIILLISCGQREKENNDLFTDTPKETTSQKVSKVDNALEFINEYVENANKKADRLDVIDWVNSNDLSTKKFKNELKKIIEDAYKKEPEVGLDFDPILDAQDNPDKGFELEVFDEKTNYLTVKGKDWQEFKLTMKIIKENGVWLVDGCGVINIPINKRAGR